MAQHNPENEEHHLKQEEHHLQHDEHHLKHDENHTQHEAHHAEHEEHHSEHEHEKPCPRPLPEQSCLVSLDYLLWPNDPSPDREYKQKQHVRAYKSPTDNKTLLYFRIFSCVFMILQMAYTVIDNTIEYTYVQMQYFTLWGVFMTMITCIFLLAGMLIYKPDQDLSNDTSAFCLWKWCSYCFQMNFFWNILISILFWGFILPTGEYVVVTHGKVNLEVKFAFDHTTPCLFLTIDWFLNGIQFEWFHMVPNTCIMYLYGLVNWSYCVVTGVEIYPVLTWDSMYAWGMAGLVLIVVLVIQALTICCTKYKIKKMFERESQGGLEHNSEHSEYVDSSTLMQKIGSLNAESIVYSSQSPKREPWRPPTTF